MDIDYLKISITIIIAVIGWVAGHYFTNKRASESKRRDLVTEHLINAYRILTHEIAHRNSKSYSSTKLENLLSDIQLFGSIEQINLAKQLADGIANKGDFELDPLINSLRNSLHKELYLKKISGNVKWLRFDDTK